MSTTSGVPGKPSNVADAGIILQAIFSVCVTEDVDDAIAECAAEIPGAEFVGQFQEYLSAEHRPQFPDFIKNAGGCVALIDCDKDRELALQTMERLQQSFPQNLRLIAVSTSTDQSFLLSAMRAGCDDVLHRPIDMPHLVASLKRFQRSFVLQTSTPSSAGKLLSFYGVKGGVGSTTLAVHLATHLVRMHKKKVLLIDHKHELGHVTLHLGMKESVYNFDELLRNADRLDAKLLEGFVARHPSGLDVIPSPDFCSRLHSGSPEATLRVMNYLRSQYDFVLVDSSLAYEQSFAAIVEVSDEVALISTPDVAALRDLVRRVEHIVTQKGLSEKLKIVINRSTSEDAVGAKEIAAAIKFPIATSVPNCYVELLSAINEGEPISPHHRGGFTLALAQWTERVVGRDLPAMTTTKSRRLKRFNIFNHA